jgi:hypothetical protein
MFDLAPDPASSVTLALLQQLGDADVFHSLHLKNIHRSY